MLLVALIVSIHALFALIGAMGAVSFFFLAGRL